MVLPFFSFDLVVVKPWSFSQQKKLYKYFKFNSPMEDSIQKFDQADRQTKMNEYQKQ